MKFGQAKRLTNLRPEALISSFIHDCDRMVLIIECLPLFGICEFAWICVDLFEFGLTNCESQRHLSVLEFDLLLQ